MVSKSAPPTTIRLFRKYRPILAEVQARAQFPNCGEEGGDHGEFKISSSVLNDETTAHSSGSAVTTAQHSIAACGSKEVRLARGGATTEETRGRSRRRVMPTPPVPYARTAAPELPT